MGLLDAKPAVKMNDKLAAEIRKQRKEHPLVSDVVIFQIAYDHVKLGGGD